MQDEDYEAAVADMSDDEKRQYREFLKRQTQTAPSITDPSPLNMNYEVRKDGTLFTVQRKRRKVAIMGFEEANGQTGPWNDSDWEVWGLNMGNRMGFHRDAAGRFRADRWFDLHPKAPQSPLDMAWIESCPMPIYLPTKFGNNPQALAYPLFDVESWLEITHRVPRGFWASSFAYMMALAMFEGFQEIGLFGCNLDWGRERIYEHGNLEFYIGLALGRGITVHRSPGSKLLSHPARYGFEYDAERNQVIQDCASVVRQLLQGEEFKAAIGGELADRIDELKRLQDEVGQGVYRIVYQKRAPEHHRIDEPSGIRALRNDEAPNG